MQMMKNLCCASVQDRDGSFRRRAHLFQSLLRCFEIGRRCFQCRKGEERTYRSNGPNASNDRQEINEVRAGDIAAAIGLKLASTGDTLCDERAVITLERMEFPDPVIHVAESLAQPLTRKK